MSSIAWPRSWTADRARVPAWVLAAIGAAAFLLLDPGTADLPAAEYRAHVGLLVWDNGWYGGHHLPGYSLLFPLLAEVLGPHLVAVLGALATAWAVERILLERWGSAARLGALWAGAATASNLFTGRLTFCLGLAFGSLAVLAATRGRYGAAAALGAVAGLGSPVAGAFLAMAAAAWWLVTRRCAAVALGACAFGPAAALTFAFPEGGPFPFVPSAFWPALAALTGVGLALPRRERVLRAGIVLYALAMIGCFAFDNPMGGNVVRLGTLLAGPLVACALVLRLRTDGRPAGRRRALLPALLVVLGAPLLYWQWTASIGELAAAGGDRSTQRSYYDGVAGFLESRPGGPFRVEVPLTRNHWEARRLAPVRPLARGWLRQLDAQVNRVFYDGRPLTAARYRRWLDDNAVRYVALPDAPMDYSAREEAALVRSGLPYLREVWRDRHWRVFAVHRARPLARGPAGVVALHPDAVTLAARSPGTVDLRVRYTPYWRITRGRGCVSPGPRGWTRVDVRAPGAIKLQATFDPRRIRATSPRCAT